MGDHPEWAEALCKRGRVLEGTAQIFKEACIHETLQLKDGTEFTWEYADVSKLFEYFSREFYDFGQLLGNMREADSCTFEKP